MREALLTAIERATRVHNDQLPAPGTTELGPGAVVHQTWRPVRRVGLYVPGGRAVYPSSVVMNVVPARVAGVESMAVVSPPQVDHDGWPHPTILAACRLLGIDEVYAAGGAQAVAMLALGVEGCEPVNVITGPGNIYVTEAKRLLRGTVGIDSEAGPTEIAIVADDSADPAFVAADLISQAEHDVVAASVLITDSEALANAVDEQLEIQVPAAKHSDRIRQALTGRQSAAVITTDIPKRWPRPTRTPPNTWRSTPAMPPPMPQPSATPARSSWARTVRCPWATTWRVPTMCCPRPDARATPAV